MTTSSEINSTSMATTESNTSSNISPGPAPITGIKFQPITYLSEVDSQIAVFIVVSDLVVFEAKSGKLIRSISLVDSEDQDQLLSKEHLVLDACFNAQGTKFAVVTDNKILRVFDADSWNIIFERALVKRATAVAFTFSTGEICIADKFGDAYRFKIGEEVQSLDPIVGHVSVLTDVAISSDDQFIITSDRDEKVRVSCYPNGYNIHSFCLGHKEFVSSVCLPFLSESSRMIISGGGDSYILVSDYFTGRPISKIAYDTLLQLETIPPRLTVAKIISSPQSGSQPTSWVVLIIENMPKILLFKASTTEVVFSQLIELSASPICLEFDSSDSFYLALPSKSSPSVEHFTINEGQFAKSISQNPLIEAVISNCNKASPHELKLPLIGDYRKLRPGAPGSEKLGIKTEQSDEEDLPETVDSSKKVKSSP